MCFEFIKNDVFQEMYDCKNNHENIQGSSVAVGICPINNHKVICIRLSKKFKMGTIGVIEGEIITLAFEYAIKKRLPVIAIVASGGIRVHEGTIALMQMAKIASVVKKHNDKNLLFISVIKNPTLGGTSASFVSLADIIIAEKDAIYGFSGRRIIEDTTHELLPNDFQTADYAKRHGMVDIVSDKEQIIKIISKLIRLHIN